MKKAIKFSLIATLFILTSCSSTNMLSKNKIPKQIDVNEVFKKVYHDVENALSDDEVLKNTIKLESIDLEFATVTTVGGEAGLKLWVVSGKYSRSFSNSNKTIFSLTDLSQIQTKKLTKPAYDKLTKYLISSILAAQSINPIGNFGLKEFEVEVSYTINQSGEIGAEIELLPVTAGLTVKKEKEISHTITIKFSKQ